MSLRNNEITKLYYSIGEVSEMFNVSKSLIRFWESEFDLLRPHKNSKGNRRFTEQNIEQFRTIYHLVKERGFTLEGAKRELKLHKETKAMKRKTLESLTNLRNFLESLKDEI